MGCFNATGYKPVDRETGAKEEIAHCAEAREAEVGLIATTSFCWAMGKASRVALEVFGPMIADTPSR